MSDYDDDTLDDRDDSPEAANTSGKNWRREMERERAEAKAEAARVKAEADTARKELAFMRAGIDLNGELTPQQKLFVKAYDGDITADAVKAAATEYGVLEAPVVPAVPDAELAAHERFAQAAGTPLPPDGDVHLAAIENAQSEAEVLAALQKINPDMVDTKSRVQKWMYGGDQGTPQTTPAS